MTHAQGKIEVRITGFPEASELLQRLKAYAEKHSIGISTAARILIRAGLDAEATK